MKKFLALICAATTLVFTSCDNDDNEPATPLSIVTFEDATLNSEGILREGTFIEENDDQSGNFWAAYAEKEITLRSYVSTAFPFWCGFQVSNNHDMTTEGYINEASVYNAQGKSGSKFAICYDGGTAMMGSGYESEIFVTDGTNKVFDHIYVTNSTYTALSMKNGDGYAKKFETGDWFKLTITGIDNLGEVKGTKEFYLADFRSTSSVGIVTEWTKVDLTSLGAVQKLQFSFSSSDNDAMYGMKTPAYFCLDDIAIQK